MNIWEIDWTPDKRYKDQCDNIWEVDGTIEAPETLYHYIYGERIEDFFTARKLTELELVEIEGEKEMEAKEALERMGRMKQVQARENVKQLEAVIAWLDEEELIYEEVFGEALNQLEDRALEGFLASRVDALKVVKGLAIARKEEEERML